MPGASSCWRKASRGLVEPVDVRGPVTDSGDRDAFHVWKARIERANRSWGAFRQSCEKYYDAYKNKFTGPASEDPSYISTPLAFVHAKVKLPRLTLQNPYVRVRPRTPFSMPSMDDTGLQGVPMPVPALDSMGNEVAQVRDNIRGAEILEAAVNYELREMAFKNQVKLAILDAMLAGYGLLKLGYDTEYTYKARAEIEERLKAQLEGTEPRAGLEWNELIKRESVWAKRVSPWDFRYDPDIKQLDPWLSDARWVAFRNVRPLKDVRKDPIYKNTRSLEASATSRGDADTPDKYDHSTRIDTDIPGDPEGGVDHDIETVHEGFVVLWEIWSKPDRKLYVIADGHDGFLREDDWPFDMEGPPVAFLHFHDVPDNRFPMPDIAPWFDQNELLNLCNSMDADAIKRRVNKFLYPEGAITTDQLRKLEQPLNSQFVKVSQPEAIKEMKVSIASGMETAPYIQRLMFDIYQLSGIGENQRGGDAPDKTATEAKIVEQNVAARLSEEQDRVQDWATVAIRKIIQIMQQLFTKQRMAPILGRPTPEWFPYTKDQIQGEYDINIELAPYNPMKTELAIKQITDLIALLSKIAPMSLLPSNGMLIPVNMAKLVEDLLRQMSPNVKPQEILMHLQAQPNPAMAPGMGAPPGQSPAPGAPGNGPQGGVPLPGEGRGADKRSDFASQGAGAAMTQAAREGSQLAGARTPSRGR